MRRLLRSKPRLGESVYLTTVQLNDWVSSIQADAAEQSLTGTPARAMISPSGELIKNIAESLIEQASGTEWVLLSKSLQETLLYCTGIDMDLDYLEIKARLTGYLASRGRANLIEQFLCFCVFNFVWFQVGDSFRATAETPVSFEEDLDDVERICQKIVASAWPPYASSPLDKNSAEKLIRIIDQQLRSDPPIRSI
jgi:hypothetical protein